MELPSNNRSYAEAQYWQQRFQNQEQYDWLGTFDNFKGTLFAEFPELASAAQTLVLGCGNSTLSRDLRNAGFKSVTSIDYSPTVISKMQQKYQDDNDLHWLVSDMRDMSNIGTAKYDLVIEKGALDAFMAKESNVWEPALEVCVDVGKALTEIRRVMKPGGLYIQISFQQPHFRKRYLAVKVDPTDLSNYDCQNNLYKWKVKSRQLDYGLGYFMYSCITEQ